MTSRVWSGESAGPPEPDALDPAVRIALEWVTDRAPSALAVFLSGSHAGGEAVWRPFGTGRVCLSDLDVYVLAVDGAARRAVESRLGAARPEIAARLRPLGLLGPLEVAAYDPSSWARMPARPATIELRRHGRLVSGDGVWLQRLPDWSARDVSPEEILLLHENRAFELIAARAPVPAGDPLAEMRARHATFKCALDLAGVARLRSGGWEDGAEARVAAARVVNGGARTDDPPWDEALAWRRGEPGIEGPDLWGRTARSWVRLWSEMVSPGAGPENFERTATTAARRARLRRRLRVALLDGSRSGAGPGLGARLSHALAGTPQHRLDASAGAFLAALVAELEAPPAERPAIRARRRALLDSLGSVKDDGDDAALGRALVSTWDRWVLDGQRTGVVV